MRPTVYLAGPMSGLTRAQAAAWRQDAADRLESSGIRTLSPLRDTEYLGDDPIHAGEYDDPFGSAQAMTRRDFNDVVRCDLVLVNYAGSDGASIGTAIEIGWAYALRTPIITVLPTGSLYHAMIDECSLAVTTTLSEALSMVTSVLA